MSIKVLARPTQIVLEGQPHAKLTDVSILGVPDNLANRYPSVSGYPKKFNPEGLRIWTKIVNDPEWKKSQKLVKSVEEVWHNTILYFLAECRKSGLIPFANNTDVARNEYVSDFLTNARMEIVKYTNSIDIFSKVKVRKAFREYKRRDAGLTVMSWAEIYPIDDPTFKEWLTKAPLPRFSLVSGNRYQRVIRPHIRMWVKYINQARITIGFEIDVAGTINIPGKSTPTRKEVDRFMDNTIFLPIIRSHRFDGVKNRLF